MLFPGFVIVLVVFFDKLLYAARPYDTISSPLDIVASGRPAQ
jgi:hypothetical protein